MTATRRQWLLLIAAMLLLGGSMAVTLFRQHGSIDALEKERLSIQARVVDENLGHQLVGVNQALVSIQNAMVKGSDKMVSDAASRHLLTLSSAMPGVRTLLVLNAQGTVTASNHAPLLGQNFRERTYFQVAQQQADASTLHVLAPFKTGLGVYALVLSRSVIDSDGKFTGVVTATLDPTYFTILLGSVHYAPDMRISLVHGDGQVFLDVPYTDKTINMDLAQPDTFYSRHVASGRDASLFSGCMKSAGEDRMMAVRTIRPAGMWMDKPLIVAVSRDQSAIFTSWRREALLYGGFYFLLGLVLASGLYLRQRQQQAYAVLLARQAVKRLKRETVLRDSERFLATLVDAVPGMAGYWNAELRCTYANQEYLSWFGKRSDQMRGMRMQDLLGEALFSQDAPYVERALQGEAQHFERTLIRPGGEVVYTWAHYLPDIEGQEVRGFFVLVSDVSALKKAQFQLEKLNQDLELRTSQLEAAVTNYQRAETELRIIATAFESQQAIIITDANTIILRVNRAFTESTGYASDEIVGQTPRLLQSGRHDTGFYQAMWASILSSGAWQGELWDRRKNGETYPSWITITAIKNQEGIVTHYVSTQADITERKTAEEAIRHLAFYDPLTRLPNRRLLMDRLRQGQINRARSGYCGALMFMDLDNFKTLNDTLGHDKGDLLLEQVAQRLPACVREVDTVARLGGDEFVVMLEELSNLPQQAATKAELIGETILAALNQPYQLAGHLYHCTASIGVTLLSDPQNSIEELMKQADVAMYQAKAAGRNTLRFFDPYMQAVVTAHAELEVELRHALLNNEFALYYQAQIEGKSAITGAEVLVRWRHPLRGLVAPAEFIPLAEQTGLIVPLGQWVLHQACRQLTAWSFQPKMAHLTVAVNISARQFHRPDFVQHVLSAIHESGANPLKLKLELTESMLLDDMEDIIGKMTELKTLGIGFSLDDFGTGYSSLFYLKHLPLDQLKIDQSFVRDLLTDPNDAAIVRTIVTLGQSLGLAVIAEGVENEEQRLFLASHDCHAYQGHFFSPPVPVEEFEHLIQLMDGLTAEDACPPEPAGPFAGVDPAPQQGVSRIL